MKQFFKDSIKFFLKFIFVAFLISEFFFVGWAAYLVTSSDQTGGGFQTLGLLYFLIPFMVICISGAVFSLLLFAVRQKRMGATLLICSIVTFPLSPWAQGVDRVVGLPMIPWIKLQVKKKQVENNRAYELQKENDYKVLKSIFSLPQKVAKIEGNLLLLENQKVVRLTRYFSYLPLELRETFLKSKLLGQSVMIDLGSFEEFSKNYFPGGIDNIYLKIRGITLEQAESEAIAWPIPADVIIDGERINELILKKITNH